MTLKINRSGQIIAAIRRCFLTVLLLLFIFGCVIPVSFAIADSAKSSVLESSNFPEQPEEISPQRRVGLQSALEQFKLLPSPNGLGGEDGQFGYSVSVSGNLALIGGINLGGAGAAIVFENSDTGWAEVAILRPSDGEQGDQFGFSVSLLGDRALIGSRFDVVNATESGSVYVFDFNGSNWIETTKLRASDGEDFDEFGHSVSLTGDRALVGARRDDDNGNNSGSVYVFDFNGGLWSETAKLTAVDGASDDEFGYSVSLSGDRALVGAYRDDDNGDSSGSVYLFDFDGSTWSETAKLLSIDGAPFDQFGFSVSLLGDRALIGAVNGGNNLGSAYVFDFNGMDWSETTKLTASDGAPFDDFGYSVSLSGDRALVGTRRGDDNGMDSGIAYLFDFNGTSWSETTKLTDPEGAQGDHFGHSVSLSGDRALVGAIFDDDSGDDSGSAYFFNFNGSNWVDSSKLLASEGAVNDQFGRSVSLSGDRALVGVSGDDDNGSGAGSVYVYDFDETAWNESVKLIANDGTERGFFGFSVSLSGDRMLVGAIGDDDNGSNSGAAYVFDFDGLRWNQTAKLTPSDGAPPGQFGYSVSLSGDRALIGAPFGGGSFSGSAYIFEFNGISWVETAKLTPNVGIRARRFGWSVSLLGDQALIGASRDSVNGSDSGSAFVFDYNGVFWNETANLIPDDGMRDASFGYSVSLFNDRALIGAPGNFNPSVSGSAYVFDFNGNDWSQSTKLLSQDSVVQDGFGLSVSLSGDRALVGSRSGLNDSFSGSAYVFEFDGLTWNETAKLTANDGATGNSFGSSISLSGDRVLVGAPGDDDHGTSSGSAYILSSFPFFKDGFESASQPSALNTDG